MLDTILKDTADETIAYYDEHVADFPLHHRYPERPKGINRQFLLLSRKWSAGNGIVLMVSERVCHYLLQQEWKQKVRSVLSTLRYPINIAIIVIEEEERQRNQSARWYAPSLLSTPCEKQ
jgi:hypothetical protein